MAKTATKRSVEGEGKYALWHPNPLWKERKERKGKGRVTNKEGSSSAQDYKDDI